MSHLVTCGSAARQAGAARVRGGELLQRSVCAGVCRLLTVSAGRTLRIHPRHRFAAILWRRTHAYSGATSQGGTAAVREVCHALTWCPRAAPCCRGRFARCAVSCVPVRHPPFSGSPAHPRFRLRVRTFVFLYCFFCLLLPFLFARLFSQSAVELQLRSLHGAAHTVTRAPLGTGAHMCVCCLASRPAACRVPGLSIFHAAAARVAFIASVVCVCVACVSPVPPHICRAVPVCVRVCACACPPVPPLPSPALAGGRLESPRRLLPLRGVLPLRAWRRVLRRPPADSRPYFRPPAVASRRCR